MKNNQKFLTGLLIGAAAGAVVTAFLQSEKGKAFVNNAKTVVKDAAGDIKESMGNLNLDETLSKIADKGRDILSNLKKKKSAEDLYSYEEIFS